MRLVRFRQAEPASPLCLAALARWCQLEGDARTGLEFLDKYRPEVQDPEQDPFYMAASISILIELGELERADRCFQKWPGPREGYEFWVTQGKVLEEARGQYAEASRAYDRALAEWPGQIDWRTRNRKANCLARLRDQAGAARQREQAKAIENLMDEKIHRSLRQSLGSLGVPEQAKKMVDFYQKINRPREAAAWSDHVARLQSQPAGQRALDGTTKK
jgi:tetratricopeptide (TPR) repeat protein